MKKKIAIVDDVLPNALLLKGYAKDLDDTEAVTFTDPAEALKWCAANEPDLVMLDYVMPEMDGCAFLDRFRKIDRLKDIPVVIITAEDSKETLYQALQAGANDFLRKPVDQIELLARARNMLELRERQVELAKANERLFVLATTDPLTGLANRRYFLQSLSQEIERCRRYQRRCSVAMLDADNFKAINDTYGHDVGDQVLQRIARVMLEELRSVDLVGRLGGEEFAIQMVDTDLDCGLETCRRLRDMIREATLRARATEIGVTVSIGLTEVDRESDGTSEVIKRADRALYRAKALGRDRIEVE